MDQITKPTPAAADKAAFMSISTFPVVLTYNFTDPATVIRFKCKMALDSDDKEARQAFYMQPDGDIAAGQHAYYVDMLSRIIVARPEGLPGFDDLLSGDPGSVKRSQIAEAIRTYFRTGEPILQKVAADAIEMYNKISQPVEFFR